MTRQVTRWRPGDILAVVVLALHVLAGFVAAYLWSDAGRRCGSPPVDGPVMVRLDIDSDSKPPSTELSRAVTGGQPVGRGRVGFGT